MVSTTPEVVTVKYAELFCDWLVELGYTHCYFVAGGNIMHLLDGVRKRFTCVAVVHEVAAGIAAEYFNEAGGEGRAFALVTAGPGMTNIVTAMAGAWLESRELLVVGGQAKRSDLATGGIRQRGIQEIDGQAIAAPVSVTSVRLEEPWSKASVFDAILSGRRFRPGPVFLDVCLDAQGAPVQAAEIESDPAHVWTGPGARAITDAKASADSVVAHIRRSKRPVFLIGGGITRATAEVARTRLRRIGIPTMTTWNGIDRVAADEPHYAGRPNSWGQRSANVLLHQSDCIVALGTRLGLQQTGFNWQGFGQGATVIQAEIDPTELAKGHPRVDLPLNVDANTLLECIVDETYPDYSAWLKYCQEVRALLPTNEAVNTTGAGFISPYTFYEDLSALARSDDILVQCSSGGANFTGLQCIEQKLGQVIIGNKGLASMGYGLAGAIGAAMAHPTRRTIVIEGDGGFAQNSQELATVNVNDLNLKIFIFANNGYASIRTTQRNYFGGAYLGCDSESGLGFPDWQKLFSAYGIPLTILDESGLDEPDARASFEREGAHGFMVPIDPEQTYFPKIASRITSTGSMESNPLYLMTPELSSELSAQVFRYSTVLGPQP